MNKTKWGFVLKKQHYVMTILGSAGGVANGILSILNKSAINQNDPLHHIMNKCEIHLIDYEQKDASTYSKSFSQLKGQFVLHSF